MPIVVEWIPNESVPAILATCTGYLTVADFTEMFRQVDILIKNVEGQIFRIADYTYAESSFAEIMRTVQESNKGMAGSAGDPRIKTIYVGTTQWISLARTAFQRQGNLQIPAFHSVEDALTYIHLELERAENPTSTNQSADAS
ncbi:MAG: hypothetical protein GC204_21150 [Chloroflexi bacterium]|nr:hypothetical protein [Chloroflexota bacterium]